MVYHKNCYVTFTSSLHLGRPKKNFDAKKSPCADEEASTSSKNQTLQSNMETLDSDLCIFVNRFLPKTTRVIVTRNVSDRVINAAKHDCIMRCRLAGVSDVVVADTRNHLKCYIQIQFTRKADCEKKPRKGSDPKDMCMRKVAHEVSIRVTKGEIYSLLDVWERSVGLLSKLMMAVTSSTGHDSMISCKGCSRGNRVCVTALCHSSPHEPRLLFQVVPLKVGVRTLNETKDELEDVVSEQGLHTCLSGQTDEYADDTTRKLSLSFGQDTVHAISKGKTLTPKHVGFGMSIHHATRSRTLVSLFHNAGHSISYSQVHSISYSPVQRVDTTLAKRTLLGIPSVTVRYSVLTQLWQREHCWACHQLQSRTGC